MRFRFTPNDNGQGLDSRSEAAQDPKLHKRYFAGYTGTANSLKTCLVRKQVTFEHPMLL